MITDITPPDLEKRFQKPDGWQWDYCERKGRIIRLGHVFPENTTPDAIVVCLSGVREFSEKYYETARWCLARNLAFRTFDWVGQGKSKRYLSDPQKRHSTGFKRDIDDLHTIVIKYVQSQNKTHIPLVMLAHSMGANPALRYLHRYPGIFACAALTAPLIGIKKFAAVPQYFALAAALACRLCAGRLAIPGTKKDIPLSSDSARAALHERWCAADPALRCGNVTFGWVHAAQKSCMALQNPAVHTMIQTPCPVRPARA